MARLCLTNLLAHEAATGDATVRRFCWLRPRAALDGAANSLGPRIRTQCNGALMPFSCGKCDSVPPAGAKFYSRRSNPVS